MKCDIKIMASPKRRAYVEEMVERLHLDIDKDVFFDDRTDPKGAMYTARKTWLLPFEDESVTHRCVLQDDVLTGKDFEHIIQRLVSTYPDEVFSLYCSRTALVDMKKDGNYVEIAGCGVWGQGVIIPRKHIQPLFAWVDSINPDYPHDDTAIGEYAKFHGVRVLTTVPNLIQHNCPTASLLGYNNKNKVSKVFYPGDVRSLDWEYKANKLPSIYAPNSVPVK